ncbi:MAG: hypothetical protein AB8B96_20735 [Lysobacterales bacterium]
MHQISPINLETLSKIFSRTGLEVLQVAPDAEIPGSYWGEPEAGLIGNRLYVRPDTPLHSALHEASHYLCLSQGRRQQLHTDAGGCDDEESAVCYLQICLADLIPGIDRHQLMEDMDAWGYSFRLGTTRNWFEKDSSEAQQRLIRWALIDSQERFQFRVRMPSAQDSDE